ncbi:MAG: hypothetical protein ACK2UR_15585 [Candidatus Promineifilaceae bacterium]
MSDYKIRPSIYPDSRGCKKIEMDGPTRYEIRIKNQLDDSLAESFGMGIRHVTACETILYGPLLDQAALHGVLMRIRDLGLTLVEVKQVPDKVDEDGKG